MRLSQTFITLVFSGLALAQLPSVPPCSLQCFLDSLSSDGCSQLNDFACHCQKPELVEKVTPCVQKSCGKAEQSSVSNVVVSQCSQAGHAISVPPVTDTTPTNVDRSQVVTTTSASNVAGTSVYTSCSPIVLTSVHSSTVRTSSTPLIPTSSGTPSSSGPPSSGPPSSSSPTPPPSFTGAASNLKGNIAGAAAMAAAAIYAA